MAEDYLSKIAKIIPHLSTENEIEIISAVNAIKRILKSNGKTVHDLSEIILKKQPAREYRSYEETFKHSKKVDLSKQKSMADFINKNDDNPGFIVSAWESEFWADIQDRIYKWELTDKQMSIVQRIYDKAKKATQ